LLANEPLVTPKSRALFIGALQELGWGEWEDLVARPLWINTSMSRSTLFCIDRLRANFAVIQAELSDRSAPADQTNW
jgi:hypothetical protein